MEIATTMRIVAMLLMDTIGGRAVGEAVWEVAGRVSHTPDNLARARQLGDGVLAILRPESGKTAWKM
jgi:hypothetical protein